MGQPHDTLTRPVPEETYGEKCNGVLQAEWPFCYPHQHIKARRYCRTEVPDLYSMEFHEKLSIKNLPWNFHKKRFSW